MRDTLAARVREGRLSLLAPRNLTEPLAFKQPRYSQGEYTATLSALQRLRGRVYVDDGALPASALSLDGRHISPLDNESWHLLVHDDNGHLCGCMRYTLRSRRVDLKQLHVMRNDWAALHAWGGLVRPAVHALINQADTERIGFAEVGGWALTASARDSVRALLMLVATYAFYRVLGNVKAVATATVRNNSAGMLMRFGAQRLAFNGLSTPEYDDEEFGCRMQLLSFDSRRVSPRFEPLVAAAERTMLDCRVVLNSPCHVDARQSLHVESHAPGHA